MTEPSNQYPTISSTSQDNNNTNKNLLLTLCDKQPNKTERISTDIGLTRKFLFKRNNNFTKQKALKQSCIAPKEIVSNVNETYDYLKSHKNQQDHHFSFKNAKMYETMTRFKEYQKRSKILTANSSRDGIRSKIGKTTSIDKNFSYDKYKNLTQINEMNILLSKKYLLNENFLFKNVIKEIKFYYPDQFNILSEYFKMNSEIINSRQKEIQMFSVILGVITQIIESSPNTNNYDIVIQIYDALFEDFSVHLSTNSLKRSSFISQLWNLKQDVFDSKIEQMSTEINELAAKNEGLNEIKYTNNEMIKKLELDVQNLSKNLEVLKRENGNLLSLLEEKEGYIKDLEINLEQANKNLEKRNEVYNDLLNKYKTRFKLVGGNLHFKKVKERDETDIPKRTSDQDENTNSICTSAIGDFLEPKSKISSNMNIPNVSLLLKGNTSDNVSSNGDNASFVRRSTNFHTVRQRRKIPTIKSTFNNIAQKSKRSEQEEKDETEKEINNSSDLSAKEDSINHSIENKKNSIFSNTNLKFKSSLKNKIKNTTLLITEQKKMDKLIEEEPGNIFTPNFNFKRELTNKETKKIIEEITENNANDLKLYKNKGVDTQKRKDNATQTDITSMTVDIDSDNLLAVLKEVLPTHPQIVNHVQNFFSEYDFVYKQCSDLKTKLETIEENNEQIIETYTNIFATFVENIKNFNQKIKNFFHDNLTKIKEDKYIYVFLNELIGLNQDTVNSNQISSIYEFISKPDLEKINNDIEEIDEAKGTNIKKVKTNIQAYGKFNFENIFKEFFSSNTSNIKLNFSIKKVIKIINLVYFEMIDNVYFKKDNLHFNKEERFIDFGEVVYYHFVKNFGIEKLVKKKYLAFIKALFEYERGQKRISIFIKLLQINKYSSKARITRRGSTALSGLNVHPGSEIKYYSVFVSRQLLLLIQFFKVNNYILKYFEEETNTSQIYVLYPKLYDNIILFVEKFKFSEIIKKGIFDFIEKNKFSVSKSLHLVLDFDEIIEAMSLCFIKYEMSYSKNLRIIYNSMTMNKEKELEEFEFISIHQFILNHKLPFSVIDKMFSSLKNNQDKLSFEAFETFIIELDCFDTEKFNTFINNLNIGQIQNLFENLKNEIQGGQVTIIEQFSRRIHSLSFSEIGYLVESKIKMFQNNILQLNKEDFTLEHLISLRLLEQITLDLYNQNKINTFFGTLEYFYTLIEDVKPENENYLLSYLKQRKFLKM